jgi:hypothetical protein
MALRAGGMTEREAAAALGLTVTAAQKAATLDRLMEKLGFDDPYVLLIEPPQDQARMQRLTETGLAELGKHLSFTHEPPPPPRRGARFFS